MSCTDAPARTRHQSRGGLVAQHPSVTALGRGKQQDARPAAEWPMAGAGPDPSGRDAERQLETDPTPAPDPSPAPDPKPPAGPRGPEPLPGVVPPAPASAVG